MAIETLRPNAAGDETNITSQYPDSTFHWDKVDEVIADDYVTRVYTDVATYTRDLYKLPTHSEGSGTINKITLHFRCAVNNAAAKVKGAIKSDTTITETAEKDPYTDFGVDNFGDYSKEWTTNPAGGDWTWDDIDALQIGIALKGTGTANQRAYCTRVYVVVGYTAPPDPPTDVVATDGDHTDKVVVTWTKSDGATKYEVFRDDVGCGELGAVATYDDTGADAPTITAGDSVATDGDHTDKVALSLSGTQADNGTTHTYKVKAWSATGGWSDASDSDTGYRGHGALTYQWQRSDGDADSGYGNIDGATSSTHNDTAAPAPTITAGDTVATDEDHTDKVALSLSGTLANNGAGRYYKCILNASGCTEQTSSANRGYRGVGSLTYQWQRSSGDANEDYSNIDGATSSTHDDTAAPAPTITAGTGVATDGLTAYVTLSLSGESANVGAGRYYQCVLAATGAAGQTSTADRGCRGVGSLTYQWQISAGDSDADYSNISGATTEPYNHAVAHSDGRYYKCVENATGATEQTSSADRGRRKPLEVADGDLIGIRIIRR